MQQTSILVTLARTIILVTLQVATLLSSANWITTSRHPTLFSQLDQQLHGSFGIVRRYKQMVIVISCNHIGGNPMPGEQR